MSSELREQIKQDKEAIETAKSLERLELTSEFRSIITDGLFKNKPLALIEQMAHLDKDCAEYKHLLRELDAISYLRKYFADVIVAGDIALTSITDAQHMINEV